MRSNDRKGTFVNCENSANKLWQEWYLYKYKDLYEFQTVSGKEVRNDAGVNLFEHDMLSCTFQFDLDSNFEFFPLNGSICLRKLIF